MEHPTLMYLPLNEQPDHLKNANDWQPKIYKLLIVLLKCMNNTWLAEDMLHCLKMSLCINSHRIHL